MQVGFGLFRVPGAVGARDLECGLGFRVWGLGFWVRRRRMRGGGGVYGLELFDSGMVTNWSGSGLGFSI